LDIAWNCKQQMGYKYNSNNQRIDLHKDNEDKYFPKKSTPKSKYVSIHGDQMYLLSDGHGGTEAPVYFIEHLSQRIMELLNEMKYDFSNVMHQQIISRAISAIFSQVDQQYTTKKISEYKEWVAKGSKPMAKPVDDGCTMIINIIQKGWVLNCNVGDSRTVICRPSIYLKDWTPCFASTDHNMMHPAKVQEICNNGGKFVEPIGSKLQYLNVPNLQYLEGQGYTQLCNARVYRPESKEVKDVGCSHRRTLNLTSTLGDLLFKIQPPVISCVPDFSFIRLNQSEHLIIMATDGIWDHLRTDVVDMQNELMVRQVMSSLSDNLENSFLETCSMSNNRLENSLGTVCERMVNREAEENHFFDRYHFRYDDATLMLIHIDG
jgi:serine/threonine protein phosphatase PrpC